MKRTFAVVALAAVAFVFGACGTTNGAAQEAAPAPVEAEAAVEPYGYDDAQVEFELEVEDYAAE